MYGYIVGLSLLYVFCSKPILNILRRPSQQGMSPGCPWRWQHFWGPMWFAFWDGYCVPLAPC